MSPDAVSHPAHYTAGGIETIDAIEAWGLGFHLGNVVKYVSRAGKKDPNRTVEDLRKARWYLDRAIDRAEESERAERGTTDGLTPAEREWLLGNGDARPRGIMDHVEFPTTVPNYLAIRAMSNATNRDIIKSLARLGRAIRAQREREARAMQRVVRAGSAEDPSCYTFRAACVTVDPSGYDGSNRAEALHSIEGDA